MNTVSTENETKTASTNTNGHSAPATAGWPVPQFKHNLGDNPLWPEFLNALKLQREADSAESNRLADLELVVPNGTRI